MAGYQGWFRAAGDGSGAKHFAYGDEKRSGIDMWPDVREYEKNLPHSLEAGEWGNRPLFQLIRQKRHRSAF